MRSIERSLPVGILAEEVEGIASDALDIITEELRERGFHVLGHVVSYDPGPSRRSCNQYSRSATLFVRCNGHDSEHFVVIDKYGVEPDDLEKDVEKRISDNDLVMIVEDIDYRAQLT